MTLRDDDLEPDLDSREREALSRVAATMHDERPVPAAGFRGQLRRRLVGAGTERRAGLGFAARRRLASGALSVGALLLMAAAAGVADLGPLAPDPSDVVAWLQAAIG